MIKLKYGNTNTYFIQGNNGGLLVDTDYAETLPAFYKALKQNGIRVNDIQYVMATIIIMLIASRFFVRIVDATVQIDDDLGVLIVLLVVINTAIGVISYLEYRRHAK